MCKVNANGKKRGLVDCEVWNGHSWSDGSVTASCPAALLRGAEYGPRNNPWIDSFRNGPIYTEQYNFRQKFKGTITEARTAWFEATGKLWLTPAQIRDGDEERQIDKAVEKIKAFETNPDVVKIVVRALEERKERVGQAKFRARLLKEDDGTCIFTGDEIVVACHLNLPGHPLSKFGVLLRSDLATRFDYKNTSMLRPICEGDKIEFNQPGHELHGRIARLTHQKARLVSKELKELRG